MFFWYIVTYGENLKKNPCSVCAKKIGEDVLCSNRGITKIFTVNGTVEQIS